MCGGDETINDDKDKHVNLFCATIRTNMTGKLSVFFVLVALILISACIQQPETKVKPSENKSGTYSNANRLLDDYKWKLDLVQEIQQRTDALGASAAKESYVEWKRRNSEAVDAGERLATYITENRDALSYYWTSDVLVLIAKNKVTFERDNQVLERKISSFELPRMPYKWQINYYDRDGSRDLGVLTFINRDNNLPNVRFRFVFYKSGGELYSEESVPLGDIAAGATIRKKISLPGRYVAEETWSRQKVFVYINGSVKEKLSYENDEWREEPLNST